MGILEPVHGGLSEWSEWANIPDYCKSNHEVYTSFAYQKFGKLQDNLCWNMARDVDDNLFDYSSCESTLGSYFKKISGIDVTFMILVNHEVINDGHSAWNLKVKDMCPMRCHVHVSKRECTYKPPCLTDTGSFTKKNGNIDNCDQVDIWIDWKDFTDVCSKTVGTMLTKYNYGSADYYDTEGNGITLNTSSNVKVEEICQSTCEKAGQYSCDPAPG